MNEQLIKLTSHDKHVEVTVGYRKIFLTYHNAMISRLELTAINNSLAACNVSLENSISKKKKKS